MNANQGLTSLVLALALAPAAIQAKPEIYSSVPMLGTEEVPPNASAGYGAITAVYDEDSNQLYYEFEWQLGGEADAIAVHFHGPANIGESAPPVIDLGPISGNSGKESGVVVLTEAEELELEAGLWYLNIHSDAFPGGELRGQMRDLSPLDSAAFYDPTRGRLKLDNVMVPGLGIVEAELDLILNRFPLSFELDRVEFELLDDEDEDEFEGPNDDS